MSTNNNGLDERDESRIADGEELATVSAEEVLMIQRDDEGDLLPVKQQVPGRDVAVRVIPPSSGFYEKYMNPVDTEDNAKFAEMLNKSFPDLPHVTAEDIENDMLMFGAGTAIELIKRAGGLDMQEALESDGSEEMDMLMSMFDSPTEMIRALNEMDEDEIEGLANEAAEEERNHPGLRQNPRS